ncbi:MAG: OmpA family protein [Bacteroidetes bacterium]|nr:OmpA family protein [Bacteroidota bacterium]
MNRQIVIICLVFCAPILYRAQTNLLPNPSFEVFKSKSKLITSALPWKNLNSVDYYREPFKADTSKYKGAHSGVGYGGIRFQKAYKEFLFTKLQQPLKKGTVYYFETYVRLSFWSNASIKSFGAYFSKTNYKTSDKVDSSNSVVTFIKKGLFDNDKWIKISGTFRASGGEKIITIGNFTDNFKKEFTKLKPFKIEFVKSEAYYFIDDLLLTEYKDTSKLAKLETFKLLEDTVFKKGITFKQGQIVLLDNVKFEPNQADLLLESTLQMDKFIDYLENHPDSEVEIIAHTDNSVSRKVAKKLSKARAKAIAEYLASRDVLNKLYIKGLGSDYPLYLEDKDASKNDRVEFVVIKE